MAAANPRQDLHYSSTQQHSGIAARMSQLMNPDLSGYLSPYATSSLKTSSVQQIWPSQEGNDVELPASPLSVSGSSRSRSPDLLSYPSRLLTAQAITTMSVSGVNVQRGLLTSTTIPTNDHPSSEYPGVSEQFDHTATIQTEDDGDIEDDRKHVDTCSDGVYLYSAASDSFIGVSLSSPSPPHVLDASNPGEVIVISDDDDSEDQTVIPELSLHTPKRFSNVNVLPFQTAHDAHVGRNQNHPAHGSTTVQQPQQGFRALSTPVPASKGHDVLPRSSSRQSSVLRCSNLKEVRAKANVADLDIMVMTRESSTTIESARSSADLEDRTGPQADSAAVTITGIFQSWVVDANVADVQRLEWEGLAESQRDDKKAGNVWKIDMLLRNVKRQIQAKLRGMFRVLNLHKTLLTKIVDGHVFILQKMPPATYKAKLTTCGRPGCPARKQPRSVPRIQPGAYRLSLEPISHLNRPDIPLAAMYTIREIERPADNRDPLCGKRKDGVVWYCLTCVEDLWDGAGMLQAVPDKADLQPKRPCPPRRKVPDLSLAAAGKPCGLPVDRRSGSETAAFAPASATRAFLAPRANAASLHDSSRAALSLVAAGEPSPWPFRSISGSGSAAFLPASALIGFPRNSANAAFSPKAPGTSLRITPGPLTFWANGGQERRSVASTFDDGHQNGTLGSPSPQARTGPPQRRFLVPQSHVQRSPRIIVAQGDQPLNNVPLAEPRTLTGSTVLGAAARILPSNQHQSDGTNDASSSTTNPPRSSTGFHPTVPSLKPHYNWPPSIPTLASISQFIYPETRHDPTNTGYYALSSPQLYALRKWKAVHTYAAIFDNDANRAFMEGHGSHYGYANEGVGEVYRSGEERMSRGIMEVGGLVVEVKGEEVKGRELSEVLRLVDARVEREWMAQGWVDKGPPPTAGMRNRRESTGASADAGAGEGRKRVKLTLKMRAGEKEDGSADEADMEDELVEDGGKRAKITLWMGSAKRVAGTR